MSDERRSLPGGLTCAEVDEMAGAYVLGAAAPDEEHRIQAHLATCPETHPEFAELGGVVAALATTIEPVDAPPDLKRNVMAAYEREMGASSVARPAPLAEQTDEPYASRGGFALPRWLGWAAAGAAVLVLAVLGVWALGVQQRADEQAHRSQVVAEALRVLAQPDSSYALMAGSGSAEGASGFTAVSADGQGYMVMTNLPQAPAGMTYQAWYVTADGLPASAGTMTVDQDGVAIAENISPVDGTSLMALTLEPTGGSPEPTSDPIVVGEMVTRA
jgi:anti-sigma-K factor RskA